MSGSRHALARLASPPVLMVVLGLALYPLVREERPERVLRLSPGQVSRTLRDERARSDAPETAETQRAAIDRALEAEALAEYALEHALHREDDALRDTLAAAARRALAAQTAPLEPTRDELHALAAEVPLEPVYDVTATRDAADGRPAQVERLGRTTLRDLEERLALSPLAVPPEDRARVRAVARDGASWTLELAKHDETDDERMVRAKPEVERRLGERLERARVASALGGILAGYDRVERP